VEHDWVAQLERDDVALPAEEKGTGVSGSGILIADGGFALGTRRQLAASVAGKRGELSAGARTGSRVGRCREGGGTQRQLQGRGGLVDLYHQRSSTEARGMRETEATNGKSKAARSEELVSTRVSTNAFPR